MTGVRSRMVGGPVVRPRIPRAAARVAPPTFAVGGPLSAPGLLALQRQVGNRAVADLVVSRVPVAPFKPVAEFDTITLGQFDEYARAKPDWSTDTALTAARRKTLFSTLEFARAGDPAPVGPCHDIPLKDIEDTGLPVATRETLRTYSRGKVAKDTAGVQGTAVLADAIRDGEALKKLEAGIPKQQLHQVMGKTEEGKGEFPELVKAGKIDDFVTYIRRSHAYLEADNGRDVLSYREMNALEGKDPVSYVGTLPHVHNYHRFEAALLDQLVTNEAITDRAKPLLLILHTGSDHNGAFRRDAELTSLVRHPRNLAIMVEGGVSLEAVGGEAHRIAIRQGQHRRIQQLMLAGHGAPTSMDIAGKPQKGGGLPTRESLDLVANKARTEKFLRGLVKNMDTGPDARIVLNACLTAADEVTKTLPSNPADAKRAILKSLRNSPNLAQRLQQLAPGRTVEGNVSSVPAGSYMAVDPVTGAPTGVLHQIIPTDPHATEINRPVYIEEGKEPEGCMRAVIAEWALDRTECLKRVDARRLAHLDGSWQDIVIHAFYDIVHDHPDDASLMNRIANFAARGFSEYDDEAEQVPGSLAGLWFKFSATETDLILGALYSSMSPTGKLAADQVWMLRTAARKPIFMTLLDTFATTADAEEHLAVGWLKPSLASLLPVADAPTASRAQMKLALYAVSTKEAAAFLKANAAGTGKLTMPAGTTVPGLTANNLTEDMVLSAIGVLSAPAAAPNVDLDGDGVADIYVRSLTREAMVTATRIWVRKRPEFGSAKLDTVPGRAQVDVIGEVGRWFAIDHKGGIAFVAKVWVRPLRVP